MAHIPTHDKFRVGPLQGAGTFLCLLLFAEGGLRDRIVLVAIVDRHAQHADQHAVQVAR